MAENPAIHGLALSGVPNRHQSEFFSDRNPIRAILNWHSIAVKQMKTQIIGR